MKLVYFKSYIFSMNAILHGSNKIFDFHKFETFIRSSQIPQKLLVGINYSVIIFYTFIDFFFNLLHL